MVSYFCSIFTLLWAKPWSAWLSRVFNHLWPEHRFVGQFTFTVNWKFESLLPWYYSVCFNFCITFTWCSYMGMQFMYTASTNVPFAFHWAKCTDILFPYFVCQIHGRKSHFSSSELDYEGIDVWELMQSDELEHAVPRSSDCQPARVILFIYFYLGSMIIQHFRTIKFKSNLVCIIVDNMWLSNA